ncbi:MAG: transrane protein [Thermoleophilia bacterium]|nr:transrane protein [Thermoleophilia bacterium]
MVGSVNNFQMMLSVGGSGGLDAQSVLAGATSTTTGGGNVAIPTTFTAAAPANMSQADVDRLSALLNARMRSIVEQLQAQVVAKYTRHNGQSAEDGAFEGRVTELVNKERAKEGLKPLAYSGMLDSAAEAHNEQQVAVGVMAHEGLGDSDPGQRIRSAGFDKAWGENVATGQTTPEQVVAEWMASPGHRRNIMDADFTKLGVSYAAAANGRSYWAQSFGA